MRLKDLAHTRAPNLSSFIHNFSHLTKVHPNVNSLSRTAANMNDPKESLGLATRIYVREILLSWRVYFCFCSRNKADFDMRRQLDQLKMVCLVST